MFDIQWKKTQTNFVVNFRLIEINYICRNTNYQQSRIIYKCDLKTCDASALIASRDYEFPLLALGMDNTSVRKAL